MRKVVLVSACAAAACAVAVALWPRDAARPSAAAPGTRGLQWNYFFPAPTRDAQPGTDPVRPGTDSARAALTRAQAERALERVLSSPTRLDRSREMIALCDRLGPGDMPALIEAVRAIRPGQEGDALAMVAFARWVQESPHDALKFAATLKGPFRAGAMRGIAVNWSERDPEAALQHLAAEYRDAFYNFNPAGHSQALMAGYANGLTRLDPILAMGFAESLADTPSARVAYRIGADTWAREDGLAAAEFLDKLPPGGNRRVALEGLFAGWSDADAPAAWQWASQNLSNPEERKLALTTAAAAWATWDPGAAAASTSALPDGPERDAVITTLGTRWGTMDLAAATDWLLTLPDNPVRAAVFGEVARSQMTSDAEIVLQWLEGLPPGVSRDAAVGSYAAAAVATRPEQAAGWAASIADPAARNARLAHVIATWAATDRPAADAWLRHAGYDDAARAQLLR